MVESGGPSRKAATAEVVGRTCGSIGVLLEPGRELEQLPPAHLPLQLSLQLGRPQRVEGSLRTSGGLAELGSATQAGPPVD